MWCVTRHTSIVPSSGPVNRRRVWETGDTTLTERWLTGSCSAPPPRAWAMAETFMAGIQSSQGGWWEGNSSLHTLVDKESPHHRRHPERPQCAHPYSSEAAHICTHTSTKESAEKGRGATWKTRAWQDTLAATVISDAAPVKTEEKQDADMH